MRKAVDIWAAHFGVTVGVERKLIRTQAEVEAWEKEQDDYYGNVRVALAKLLDDLFTTYSKVHDIQDNPRLSKTEEILQVGQKCRSKIVPGDRNSRGSGRKCTRGP